MAAICVGPAPSSLQGNLQRSSNFRGPQSKGSPQRNRCQAAETAVRGGHMQSWLGLFGQVFRLDRWSVCRVQAAAICGRRVK